MNNNNFTIQLRTCPKTNYAFMIPPLSKTYNLAIMKLLDEVFNSDRLWKIQNLFNDFLKKFTMIPQLWEYCLILEDHEEFYDYEGYKSIYENEIRRKAKTHFIIDAKYIVTGGGDKPLKYKLFDIEIPEHKWECKTMEDQKICEKVLSFPNKNFEKMLKFFKIHSIRPLPPSNSKNLDKAEILSKQMEAFKDYPEKWFKTLIKWKNIDEKFVIDNIEFKLAKNPANIGLWKLYLNFLKKYKNDTRILDVYFRYCRIFIEDFEMRNEYRNEIERLGNLTTIDVSKWWIDTIEFELTFGDLNRAWLFITMALKNCETKELLNFAIEFQKQYGTKKIYEIYVSKLIKKILSTPVFEKIQIEEVKENFSITSKTNISGFAEDLKKQNLCLPFPLINHIFDECTLELKQRLYESCKYFFIKCGKKPICHSFGVDFQESFKYKSQSFSMFAINKIQTTKNKNIKNLIISNSLNICNGFNSLSILLQQKHRIQIKVKVLLICDQNLSCKEFNLLVSPRLELVRMGYCNIYDYVGSPLEKYFEIFRNVQSMDFNTDKCFPDTAKNLSKLQSSSIKTKELSINYLPESFIARDAQAKNEVVLF